MNQDRAPILRLEDISKSFSGVTVLDGINLNLYGHEVLALMGENGAGKSTLMNILSGNLMRDSGKIVVAKSCLGQRAQGQVRACRQETDA